jgi:hypothetical protein
MVCPIFRHRRRAHKPYETGVSTIERHGPIIALPSRLAMPSELYLLLLRSDPTYARWAPRDALRDHLRRIPNLMHQGDDLYHFGEQDEHGVMQVEFQIVRDGEQIPPDSWTEEDKERCNGVEVRIPRAWVMDRGPQVFALVFMIAEWYGWQVFDPQIGDTLQKEAVLQGLVAMCQRRLQAEGRGGPPGTQAHFVQGSRHPSEAGTETTFERPPRSEGVKMPGRQIGEDRNQPYEPRTRPSPPKSETRPRPWWNRLGS